MPQRAILAALFVSLWVAAAQAAIDVNPARPITHRVTVQLIQTALDNGTSPATVFGDASQRANIEANIDKIWAQAGIDIAFLPNVTRYNDTFAYQGNAGTGSRPQGDLTAIRLGARDEGILNPDTSVLNMFMVNVVPGFTPLGESNAAGLARIAANGIAAFTGDNLLGFQNGLDVVASVMAHEIGHNLGLDHTANGDANVMSPNGTSEQLNQSQISTVFSATSFVKLLPVVELPGDYDGDGTVDAADYTVWRNTLNQSGASLAADGNDNGRIDAGDYSIWKTNFGRTVGEGSVGISPATSVPEAGTAILAILAFVTIVCSRRVSPRR